MSAARRRRGIRARVLSLLPVILFAGAAPSQEVARHTNHIAPYGSTDSAMREFVNAARMGAAKYHDRDAAIAAGFRRVGMDFPSMGEHWVNPGKLISGKFDAGDPAMLTYATIEGRVELLGVVYAVPVAPGADPPALPDGVDRWHEHNGTVEEESMLPEHHSHPGADRSTTRLAILHLWLWVPASPGMFAADNWNLPFVRLGLMPPGDAFRWRRAARALSLLSGGKEFYSTLMLDMAGGEGISAEKAAAMDKAVGQATQIASRLKRDEEVPERSLMELEEVWRRLARSTGLLDASEPP